VNRPQQVRGLREVLQRQFEEQFLSDLPSASLLLIALS
jgi:hypothetical protein